jgi:hypothetical protein
MKVVQELTIIDMDGETFRGKGKVLAKVCSHENAGGIQLNLTIFLFELSTGSYLCVKEAEFKNHLGLEVSGPAISFEEVISMREAQKFFGPSHHLTTFLFNQLSEERCHADLPSS